MLSIGLVEVLVQLIRESPYIELRRLGIEMVCILCDELGSAAVQRLLDADIVSAVMGVSHDGRGSGDKEGNLW